MVVCQVLLGSKPFEFRVVTKVSPLKQLLTNMAPKWQQFVREGRPLDDSKPASSAGAGAAASS